MISNIGRSMDNHPPYTEEELSRVPAKKTEIETMATALERDMRVGIGHIRKLNSTLAHKFGRAYADDENAKEYYDKFNNNTSPPYSLVQVLKVYMRSPSLPAQDVMEALHDLARWKSMRSDKAQDDHDTRPRAIYRTLQHLEQFLVQHREDFSKQEWSAVSTDLAGVRDCVAKLHKHVRVAEHICNAIRPPAHGR